MAAVLIVIAVVTLDMLL